MKKWYFFVFLLHFITACHSLSDKTPSKTTEVLRKTIDKAYLRSQANWFYIKAEQKSHQGFYEQAIVSFKNVLVYHPNSFVIQFRIIDEYLKAGAYLKAFTQTKYLLKKYPNNIDLHVKLGSIYTKNKLYQKALSEYSWVLTKNKHHKVALYQKALVHLLLKEILLARPLLITLSKIEEENLHKIHYLLGQIGKQNNQTEKFVFHLKKAIALKPYFQVLVLELFTFYQKRGQKNKAIRVLEDFLQQGGTFSLIPKILLNYYRKT